VPVERGFALIALLALAALISAFLIASVLNFTSAGISNEREDRSMKALRQAKAALIAYAANEQWQLSKSQPADQPGGLPCPDTDDDGASQGLCPNAVDRIGRLPWSSIGADDLRDASGERLWYAVSSNFRRLWGTTIINSDTPGLLTVTGAAPASNVVAIVFAPGEALSGQDRITQHNLPAAYLEGFTATSPDYTFNSVATPSSTANDRLLVITQAELMAAVEPAVAARIERDIAKGLLQEYFTKWGRYPFAVPFASPPVPQGPYLGTTSTMMGLLPVTNTTTFTWQNPTITQILPGGTGSVTWNSASCSISSLTVTCIVSYCCDSDDRPDIRIQVFLTNAGIAFADALAPAAENLDILDGDSPRQHPSNQGSPYGYWSPVGSFVPTMAFATQTNGVGVLTYTGRLQNANDMKNGARITISLPAPGYLPRLTNPSGTNPNIAWFISNQWYRQTYYAMSSGLSPGGGGACSRPTPSARACLTVNNLPGSTNNKQAILVFAGRALDGQTRPSGTPADYLEGQNATPADLIFEHRAGTPTAINDRVVVVSP